MEQTLKLLSVPAILTLGGSLLAIVGAVGTGRGRRGSVRSLIVLLALMILIVAGWAITFWPGTVEASSAKLVADPLAVYVAFMTIVGTVLAVLVAANQPAEDVSGEFFAMILFIAAGLVMIGLARDLLVMFLALELVSIPGFILVGLSRRHQLAEEAAAKYFFLGVFATALTAFGFVLLYGAAGSMDLSIGTAGGSLTSAMAANAPIAKYLAIAGLLIAFVGLTFKITAVPFYFYAPDVYQGTAGSVTAIIAFLPKIAGFVALLRIAAWVGFDSEIWRTFWPVLWIVAAGTVTAGNVLALLQSDVKRILAYSSIAHSGYMLIGLAAASGLAEGLENALAAVLFYVFIYGLMTLGAFGVIGYLARLRAGGDGQDEPAKLSDLAGLARRRPGIALILAVCVFSLLGMPPAAGFWAKVYVFTAALTGDRWLIILAIVGLVNAAIAAGYYLRIIAAAYMHRSAPQAAIADDPPNATAEAVPVGLTLTAAMIIVLGLTPAGLMRLCELAAQTLTPG